MDSVQNGLLLLGVLGLLGQSMVEQDVACLALNISDSISRHIRHLNEISVCFLGKVFDLGSLLAVQLGELLQVTLGEHDNERLGLEEGLDRLEESDLLVNRVATSL